MGQAASIPTNTSPGHILALLFQIQNWDLAGLESQCMDSMPNLRKIASLGETEGKGEEGSGG